MGQNSLKQVYNRFAGCYYVFYMEERAKKQSEILLKQASYRAFPYMLNCQVSFYIQLRKKNLIFIWREKDDLECEFCSKTRKAQDSASGTSHSSTSLTVLPLLEPFIGNIIGIKQDQKTFDLN